MNRRSYTVVVGMVTLLALGASTAPNASATEKTRILPEPSAAKALLAHIASPGSIVRLPNGVLTSCLKDTLDLHWPDVGPAKQTTIWEGCSGALNSKCTSEGDANGVILAAGTTEYVLALEMTTGAGTTLIGAFVLLQREFHFTCEAFGQKQLIVVRGCQAGKDDSDEKLTKKVVILFKQWATGETKILEILPPEATKESKCLLEASVGGGGFTLAAEEAEETSEQWLQEESGGKTKEIEVLLMNK